ncbi:MAG: phenylalanine--tRNA ligase subunit alpha [Nitrospirota bacterium]
MTPEEISKLAESLHPLERKILVLFKEGEALSEQALLKSDNTLQPSQISMAVEWLQKKEILAISQETKEEWVSLAPAGKSYAKTKNPCLQIADESERRGATLLSDLGQMLEPEDRSSAIGALKKSGALHLIPGGIVEKIDYSKLTEFVDLQKTIDSLDASNHAVLLSTLSVEDQKVIETYHRKRGKSKGIFRVDERVLRSFIPTEQFRPVYEAMLATPVLDEIGLLTPEMLKDSSWRGKRFRKYNIDLPPSRMTFGRRHPYQAFLSSVREKLVSMGFSEMDGPIVESEFWNMDALYMPQFHPAREIHDVYFVKGPLYDETIPDTLVSRVAAAHETGVQSGETAFAISPRPTESGSLPPPAGGGWGYQFDSQRTRRLILRSQGTAISARTLAATPSIPGKYFSIARCFRYDAVDATHAPDFFQVEGIILGEDVHFRTLLGLLTLFAKEIAKAKEVKFLPAYFPFTEPSVEMHVRHPTLGWMELGGAGLFRPEVTEPLGVNVPVIAWGLGLDRLAMMALQLSDIRDLFSADLTMIRR